MGEGTQKMLETRVLDRINFFCLQNKACGSFFEFILSKTRVLDRISSPNGRNPFVCRLKKFILSKTRVLDRINSLNGRNPCIGRLKKFYLSKTRVSRFFCVNKWKKIGLPEKFGFFDASETIRK